MGFAVAAGLIPLVSENQDGLMSANLYSQVLRPYMITEKSFFRIHKKDLWTRKTAFIIINDNGTLSQMSIANYIKDIDILLTVLKQGYFKKNNIKLYKKDLSLYIWLNVFGNILMSSTDPIQFVGHVEEPDDSYTLINF